MGLRVGGEMVMAGGSAPKKSAGGSSDQPTQRPHVAGIITEGEAVVVVPPAIVESKKWSNVMSSAE